MQFKTLIFFLLISASCFSQQIGSAKNGNYSIKLLKIDKLFSFVYSDVNSKNSHDEKSFNFPNINTMYQIVMNGFDYKSDHQVIVQTNKDTIVKFDFKKVNGKKMLMIRQNNLLSKKFSASTFFTKKEIIGLFGNP